MPSYAERMESVALDQACSDCATLKWDMIVVAPMMTYALPAKAVAYWKHVAAAHQDYFDHVVRLASDANVRGIGMPRDVDGSLLPAGHVVGARYRLETHGTGPLS